MANLEHLRIFREGVTYWNHWRKLNPSVRPDLSNANLSQSRSVDLDDAYDLYMNGVDFRHVNLRNSNLSEICLAEADFTLANLSGSRLQNSNLNRVMFHRTIIEFTSLDYSTAIHSDFTEAQFGNVQMASLDLSAAKGLGTVRHSAPSRIDLGTLEVIIRGLLVRGVPIEQKISIEHFLRCSGNEELIEFFDERLCV